MANSNGWGDGASNNDIGWGQGADNAIGWGSIYANSWAGATDIVGTPAVDPDAQAFITAASITDPTQQSAINTLVTDLKGYGVWTKMKALYPFVGGTASAHKFNLKDPRDLDAAFRLVFNGGWTHSSTGATPNGTNGYADSKLIPSTSLSLNSTHLSVYSRTNSNTNAFDIGVNNFPNYSGIVPRWSDNNYAVYINDPSGVLISNLDSRGFYLGNRQNSNDLDSWKNSTKQVNGTTVSGALPIFPIYIGAWNQQNAFPNYYSNKELAFASIGDGLTDTEATNLYSRVQTFNTALNRNV
jgi:hypothetical protein